jgi:hypothetical protein
VKTPACHSRPVQQFGANTRRKHTAQTITARTITARTITATGGKNVSWETAKFLKGNKSRQSDDQSATFIA